ncbi:hypothetical protein ACFE04_024522 [Oxalis oulophora]
MITTVWRARWHQQERGGGGGGKMRGLYLMGVLCLGDGGELFVTVLPETINSPDIFPLASTVQHGCKEYQIAQKYTMIKMHKQHTASKEGVYVLDDKALFAVAFHGSSSAPRLVALIAQARCCGVQHVPSN